MLSPCSFAVALIGLDWTVEACDGEKIFINIWTGLLGGGRLATNAIDAGSQTYVSWLPVRTNSMVDPPKSITTYLTYHDSAMTLSMFNYIEIRESFGPQTPNPLASQLPHMRALFPENRL